MNGYIAANAWYRFVENNQKSVRPVHHSIIHWCYQLANTLKWPTEFQLPTVDSLPMVSMSDRRVFNQVLKELQEFGAIRILKESTNIHTARWVTFENLDFYLFVKPTSDTTGNDSYMEVKPTGNTTGSTTSSTTSDPPIIKVIEFNKTDINYLIIIGAKNENLPSADADYPQNFSVDIDENKSKVELIIPPKESLKNNPPSKVAAKVSPLKLKPDLGSGANGTTICKTLRQLVRDFAAKHPNAYPTDIYSAFVLHWSEPNEKRVPAWYLELTKPKGRFDIAKRLATWNRNNFESKSKPNGATNTGAKNNKLYPTAPKPKGDYGAGTVLREMES